MQHHPQGFALREPTAKKIHRSEKNPHGIHERWSADGHDKLYSIGFPIWAVVDDASGYPLDAWVLPSNRMGYIVLYVFLSLVRKYKGTPIYLQWRILLFKLPRYTAAAHHRPGLRDNPDIWLHERIEVRD